MFAIFLCCAAGYQKLVMPNHIHWFQFLYYFSSFWGLFGSHTTSFLLAGAFCLHNEPYTASKRRACLCASCCVVCFCMGEASGSFAAWSCAKFQLGRLLVAAESFPVAIRGTAHGISAATGKVNAKHA